jgi:hypothetical protein
VTETRSLGYWLVERGIMLPSDPKREYRGLDRNPDVPGPDRDADLRAQGRSRLLEIRDRFWELEDTHELHRDPQAALGLRDAFREEGIDLEVVLAEVMPAPGIQDVPHDLRSAYEQHIEQWSVEPSEVDVPAKPIGLDVTFPLPGFHSAILQPVLSEVWPAFVDSLNAFALFSDMNAASRAAELSNRTDTSWRPFCPVALSLVRDTETPRREG